MFKGTYTAIVTPFRNGEVDKPALDSLIRAQIKGGVDGIVPVGTTGESPSLDYDEHIYVIKRTVEVANGRVKVLAGTGAKSIGEALHLTKAAENHPIWSARTGCMTPRHPSSSPIGPRMRFRSSSLMIVLAVRRWACWNPLLR